MRTPSALARLTAGRRNDPWPAVTLLAVLVGGTSVPTPLWPYYQRSFGFSTLTLTLVFSVYMAALLPALLAGSRLCRRARPAVAAAGCAAIGAAVTFALAADVAGLILARILQGVAVGVASPALASIVRRHSSGQRAGLRAGTAATAGGGAGALLAGLAARYGPYPAQLPFAALGAVTAVASAAAISTAGRDTGPSHPPAATSADGTGRLVQACALTLLAWAIAGLYLAVVPGYAAASLHTRNPAVFGAAAGIMLAISACAPYGWLALHRLLSPERHVSPERHGAGVQTVGAAALAAGAAATAGASAVGGTAMLLLAATAAGAGLGLCFVTAARTVFDLARTRGDGPLTAWYASNYLGTASAVVGVGLLSTTTSLTGSVQAIAATVTAAVVGWLAAALLTSRRRSRR